MKKILVMLLCLATFIMAGCGDKYAKEKEAITKAEKAAMAMELPVVKRPDFSKMPKPTNEERKKLWKQYREDFSKLVAVEEKMLEEMRKSDAQIAELEKKAESDSDKKNLKEFKDKLRKDRIEFVKKVSKGRLYGDTFIVGVGSTWQEVEMVYGKPLNEQKKHSGVKLYKYDGIEFEDHIGGGVPPREKIMKWKSRDVQSVDVVGSNITSDAGVKIGMTRDEVFKMLKSKYIKKRDYQDNVLKDTYTTQNGIVVDTNMILQYSSKETLPCHIWFNLKEGKINKYVVSNGVI